MYNYCKNSEIIDLSLIHIYKVGMFAIGHYVSSLQEKYQNSERVIKYLEAVQEDVLENIDQFTENEPDEDDPIAALIPKLSGTKTEDVTLKYRVNLIVDNSTTEGAPVIVDYNPTYYNLVGEVESVSYTHLQQYLFNYARQFKIGA